MISNKTIKKYGLDSASLKKYFTADDKDVNVAKLIQLTANRIKNGRLKNLSEYQIWAAVDFAFDERMSQGKPAILRHIMENCHTATEVMDGLKGWGLSPETLMTRTKIDGKDGWELNQQVFTEVFLPFVSSYLLVRLAKIFNDRNLTPLFEFPPREYTAENRIICKILGEIVETVAIDFGYSATLRTFIFNALMYSVSLKFPVEKWTKDMTEEEDVEVVEKEGVRYNVPHVSRIYYDLNYPLDTLNTGTGCSYAGYWDIVPWGSVVMDDSLWNKTKVPHGTNWLDPTHAYHNYFTEVYPCTLAFPKPRQSNRSDREAVAVRYNSRSDYDSAFFRTTHFMELTPADWGLGKYTNKVWMRFIVGGDDTIMYAETMNSRPVDYIGYDADAGRGRNASLALEIMPFQDLASNAITQFLLTIKRNLLNFVFYDKDTVDPEQIATLKHNKNKQFGGLNFVGVSSMAMDKVGSPVEASFKSVNFQYADSNAPLLGLNTIISMLERVLVISAQEIGGSASHQQSKKEVELTNTSSSNRVAYTASFVDEGIEGWKRSLAETIIANMDGKEVTASIPTDVPNLEDNLAKLGFKFVDGPPRAGDSHVVVRGTISKLKLVKLVARRSDADRQNDSQTAQIMMQAIMAVANSPLLSQGVDLSSLIEGLEQAAKLAGADDDFTFKLNQDGMMAGQLQKLLAQIQQQIAAASKQVMSAVESEVVQPTAQAISGLKQEVETDKQQIAQQLAQLQAIVESVSHRVLGTAPITPPNGGPTPISPPAPPPLSQPVPVNN